MVSLYGHLTTSSTALTTRNPMAVLDSALGCARRGLEVASHGARRTVRQAVLGATDYTAALASLRSRVSVGVSGFSHAVRDSLVRLVTANYSVATARYSPLQHATAHYRPSRSAQGPRVRTGPLLRRAV